MIYFILGSHPELAKAEIKAVLGDLDVVHATDKFLLANITEKNLGRLQDRLASIVKIGHVIGELIEWDESGAADLIAAYASSAMGKNKISFGISAYDKQRRLEKETSSLGGAVKKILKETGRPVRYVTSKEPQLSSAVVDTNNLIGSGGEFVLLAVGKKTMIGQTETVQDFRAWSDRDYGRPKRDKRSGMLPPKLARMMINLSGLEPDGHNILDAFCGSGTVLMEAALMGFDPLIGSDIAEKAIKDTKKNLGWLTREFDLPELNLTLFEIPAENLSKHFTDPVDLIVSEVFLGDPRHTPADAHQLKLIEKKLLPQYEKIFAGFKSVFNDKTIAVIAFPAMKTKTGDWHRLPIQDLLERLGYKIESEHMYSRSNQLIARNIYVLTLK